MPLLAVLAALLIPSRYWITLFRTASNGDLNLLVGARLFRVALAALGLYALSARRLGWLSMSGLGRSVRPPELTRAEGFGIAAILAVATVARLSGLESDLWIDEVDWLVTYGRASFGEIATTYSSQNQHFLYSLLARGSTLVFGESFWALRLPAALLGIASVAALYLFSREVSDRADALLASLLLAVSYHHVWFSQSARGYTGLLFFVLVSSWLFLRGMKNDSPGQWLLYALSISLGIYMHQTMLFVVTCHFLAFLWAGSRSRDTLASSLSTPAFGGFVLGALLTFALHAMAIPQILGPALADLSLVSAWKNPIWTLQEGYRGLRVGFGGAIGVLLLSVLASAGFVSFLRRRPVVVYLTILPSMVGAATVIGMQHPLWPRFFFFALGFGALILVRGARAVGEQLIPARVGRRVRTISGITCATTLVMAAAPALLFAYGPKQDFSGAKDYAEANRAKGDAIVAVDLAGYAYGNLYAPEWLRVNSTEELDKIRQRSKRVWVVYTMPLRLEAYRQGLSEVLRRDFTLVRAFPGSLGGGTIYVCTTDPSLPTSTRQSKKRFQALPNAPRENRRCL
jgi:hypothetical protein